MSPCIMCFQYIRGYSVHRGGERGRGRGESGGGGERRAGEGGGGSTSVGYHEYIGGIS